MKEVFTGEVEQIKSSYVQELVWKVLGAVEADPVMGPGVFLEPAARSAVKGVSHHPDTCRVPGGLVRHIKRAVNAGVEICRSFQFGDDQIDQAIVALILHDIGKRKDWRAHARVGAEFVVGVMMRPENKGILQKAGIQTVVSIGSCIAQHMGPWTEQRIRKPLERYSLLEMAAYQADYTAARRDIVMPSVDNFDLSEVVAYWTAKKAA